MADILLYKHVLKYLCNKAIESIKLVATVFITRQTKHCVCSLLYCIIYIGVVLSCLKWYSVYVFCVKYWSKKTEFFLIFFFSSSCNKKSQNEIREI